jgi:Smr domain
VVKADDKTPFKELVKDVVPLPPGPKLVTAPMADPTAVVVRSRPARQIHVEELHGVVLGHAGDVAARVAHELGVVPPGHRPRSVDLHRMSAARAEHALGAALEQARIDGERYVLIVCGKGNHSGPLGPVLARLVVEQLCGPLARSIVAFRTAPRALGGEGAIIVRLRK